eukprot:15208_3
MSGGASHARPRACGAHPARGGETRHRGATGARGRAGRGAFGGGSSERVLHLSQDRGGGVAGASAIRTPMRMCRLLSARSRTYLAGIFVPLADCF